MTKEQEKGLSVQDELKAKIKQNSGEGEMPEFAFTPVITVDNSSEEKEVDGEKVDVRCKPRFAMKTGMEEGQKEVMSDSFSGTVIKVRYFVTKKWEKTPSIPFFFSQEFDASVFTSGAIFSVKHKVENSENEVENISYPDFKEKFAGMYKLNAVLHVLKDEQLVKVRLKGSTMSTLWAYLKQFYGKDKSVSYQGTKFTATREKEPQPYNALKLEVDESVAVNLEEVVIQQELLEPKADLAKVLGGKVINEDSEEIVVENIPFN